MALAGCAAVPSGPLLTLTVAFQDTSEVIDGQELAHFAAAVSQRSGGAIAIDVHWKSEGDTEDRISELVAERAISGSTDLALVPTRAWDEEGVTSLQALTAPFAITDERVVQRVLDDDGIRSQVLSGLSAAGVVGLDLWPAGMRHPFGFGKPVLSVADYSGAVVRAPSSVSAWAMFQAFGASSENEGSVDPTAQQVMESSYDLTLADHATGNVTFYPKADALVANAAVRARLTDAQWSVLQWAAADARRWGFENQQGDLRLALAFCAHGGVISAATDEQLAELRAAAAPVVASLLRDPLTAKVLGQVASLAAGATPQTPLTQCPGAAPAAPGVGGGGAGAAAPPGIEGVYQWDVGRDALRAAGDHDESDIAQNAGHIVAVFASGEFHWTQTGDWNIPNPVTTGTYEIRDGKLWLWGADRSWHDDMAVKTASNGDLVFSHVDEDEPTDTAGAALLSLMYKRWTKIGQLLPDGVTDIDGHYVWDASVDDFHKAGLTNDQLVNENAGHYDMTVKAGTWTFHQSGKQFIHYPDGGGTVTYADGRLTFIPGDLSWVDTATVMIGKDGTLTFGDVTDNTDDAGLIIGRLFFRVWKRVS